MTADHHYVRNLAYAFFDELSDNFLFTAWNSKKEILRNLPMVSIYVPNMIKLTPVFFLMIPLLWFRENRYCQPKERVIFFSNDINLLIALVVWKKFLFLPIGIISDWHMLYGGFKDLFVAGGSDLCITTSHRLENEIKNISPTSLVKTIYGGIDSSLYKIVESKNEIRRLLKLPEKKFLVGYVGLFTTLGMEKGISMMLEALVNLDENFCMVFVGGKSDEIKHYETLAREKNVTSRCIFLPMQEFDYVVKYEKAMDILVIPYPDKPHFRNFGFPMKLYEYMASGVPVIYTKLGLIEEVVGVHMYGIKPDNPDALREAILFIRNNQVDAMVKAEMMRTLSNNFTWKAKALNIIRAIKQIFPF